MSNKFLFITHVTPLQKRTLLRSRLFELYEIGLITQSYHNWQVIQFCAEEDLKSDEKFHRFHLPDVERSEKEKFIAALYNSDRVKSLINASDYVIKLDDDDIISPNLLERTKNFQGDLYFDRFHTFIDTSSGMVTQQERSWVASTCIHKTHHVLAPWNGPGASTIGNLLYSDHSKSWHEYYADKIQEAAPPDHPVYARVLSPSSITSAGALGEKSEVQFDKYYAYLASFGNWKRASTTDFDDYLPAIADAWTEHTGLSHQPLPKSITGTVLQNAARSVKQLLKRKLKR